MTKMQSVYGGSLTGHLSFLVPHIKLQLHLLARSGESRQGQKPLNHNSWQFNMANEEDYRAVFSNTGGSLIPMCSRANHFGDRREDKVNLFFLVHQETLKTALSLWPLIFF